MQEIGLGCSSRFSPICAAKSFLTSPTVSVGSHFTRIFLPNLSLKTISIIVMTDLFLMSLLLGPSDLHANEVTPVVTCNYFLASISI